MKLTYILTILAFGLLGCSANGPIYQEHTQSLKDSSVVYIYRPSRAINCCVAPAVYINGESSGSLKNGGYLVYELPAMKHEITVGDGSNGFEPLTYNKSLKKNESYYLKWVIGSVEELNLPALYAPRNYYLVEVKADDAQIDLKKLKLSRP
ncbi:DUF2846 domain-containing protein [uncultured Microbulbifer sp.]|uniref:DUF2846 domain-containing protein n=1 Tax=uncultured Microbulbifer sp. TaxID=348147 RepID=UPI00262C9C59|nr:DUF2846 domain-containing protein [uncultured Microbulbifer sp.]